MNRLGFDCPTCRHRLSVPADRAGKAARCPKCQAVMLAPSADSGTPVAPAAAPDLSGAARKADEADSIFSDPADGDGDSLFEDVPPRKPLVPAAMDSSQATVRVPGIPDPPSAPYTPPPVAQSATRHATGSRTAIDLFAGPPTVPDEVTNPFRRMVDEVMGEARQPDEDDLGQESEAEEFAAGSAWKTWALVAVSVYAAVATAAAVWGWTRTPGAPPAVVQPKK